MTPDEPGARDARDAFPDFDWAAAIASAAPGPCSIRGTSSAGPASDLLDGLEAGAGVALEIDGIGVLEQRVAG